MANFTWDEAYARTLEYFDGDTLACEVFLGKYALRDKQGELVEQTPTDMHRRLAREFARIEQSYPNPLSEDEIFGLFDRFRYVVPQGSPMSAVGNPHKLQSLSNCFVLPSPRDSYSSIMQTDALEVAIMKRRGGVGFDISNIRPKGMLTANAAGTTDGITVFMERYSNTCREVAQGGRRGALMLTLDCRHPEIETFINVKRDLKRVTGANVSVRLNDEFMRAVELDADYTLRWPVDVPLEQAKHVKLVKAKAVWAQIIDAAWTSAEPGVLFWDTMQRESPSDCYKHLGFETISTNPCGEIPLSATDSCRLMVMNVSSYVIAPFTPKAKFDFKLFHDHTMKAQRLMDDLVDLELEAVGRILDKVRTDPEPASVKAPELELWESIAKTGRQGRRTGLGVTAVGDAIAMLGVKYGSKASITEVSKIYQALAVAAETSSTVLAEERGAFPAYDHTLERKNPYLSRVAEASPEFAARWKKHGRRNISVTTTAPCGSVSLLTQTTSGIEPTFKLSYARRRKVNPGDQSSKVDFVDDMGDRWQSYVVHHPGLKLWMSVTGETDPIKSPYHGATAEDVDWTSSVDLQAAAQKFISHSISKTCNVPETATRELISEIYMRAWKQGCKGFTVYRENCRTGVLVAAPSQPAVDRSQSNEHAPEFTEHHAPRRPKELECDIARVTVKGEQYMVLVGMLKGRPYEVFAGVSGKIEVPKKLKRGLLVKNGKKDGIATYNLRIPMGDDDYLAFNDVVELFDNPEHGALTRIISLSLRHGVPPQFLTEQLKKDKRSDLQSFSGVVARVLKSYIKDGATPSSDKTCPACKGEKLAYLEGCISCTTCGWSRC